MKIIFQEDDGTIINELVLSEAETSAFNAGVSNSIPDWIINAIKNKARKCIDRIVEKSGRGSKYTTVQDKESIIISLKEEESDLLLSGKEQIAKKEEELLKNLPGGE